MAPGSIIRVGCAGWSLRQEQKALFPEGDTHLGENLGPLLVQLPPSLKYDAVLVEPFFSALHERYAGSVVCEPRHTSWFNSQAEETLRKFKVARVAADPPPVPGADQPGGWNGLV